MICIDPNPQLYLLAYSNMPVHLWLCVYTCSITCLDRWTTDLLKYSNIIADCFDQEGLFNLSYSQCLHGLVYIVVNSQH